MASAEDLPPEIYSAAEVRPDIMQQIGVITARWAVVDHTLTGLLTIIIGDYHTANVIYFTIVGFRARVSVVENLVKEVVLKGPERDEALVHLKGLSRLAVERNRLIHSTLTLSVEDHRVFQELRRPGKKVAFGHTEIKVADLKVHADNLRDIAVAIDAVTPLIARHLRRSSGSS